MSDLSPQQEAAIATFKTNLHLPHGGFHALIIELSKEFQLPFQKVRTVVMDVQRSVERKIRQDFTSVTEHDLSKENWLALIKAELVEMAKDNVPVMEALTNNAHYIKALGAINAPIASEYDRDMIGEDLFLAYEKEVFKPLLAMLHTSSLYWELMLAAEDLEKMIEEYRAKFSDYPQHVTAAAHLFELQQQLNAAVLTPQ